MPISEERKQILKDAFEKVAAEAFDDALKILDEMDHTSSLADLNQGEIFSMICKDPSNARKTATFALLVAAFWTAVPKGV